MLPSVIIIPAYQPPSSFPAFMRELRATTDARILVVDDGSGARFYARFAEATAVDRCTLLRYDTNRGKGYALRYAFSFAQTHFPTQTRYVTADCDGQHAPRDIVRMLQALTHTPDALILGRRNFDRAHVPLRSRFGNKVSAWLFALLFGQRVQDTQTGLRAFSHPLLPYLLSLPGDGFEYETYMLTQSGYHHIALVHVDIETRYMSVCCEDVRSHFSPLRDTWKILGVLTGAAVRYSLSAVLCAALDLLLFFALERFVFGGNEGALFVLISTVLARVFSSAVNFLLNSLYVFRRKNATSLSRYYMVWLGRLSASYALTLLVRPLATSVLSLSLLKGGIDLFLGAITFRLLRTWVFSAPTDVRSNGS